MSEISCKRWLADDGQHIDVRGLEAPDPLVAILELIERPAIIEPVTVHHFCEPMLLFTELNERGWTHKTVPGESDEVRLILTRQT